MNDLYTAINCNCWARAKMLEQIMEGYEEPLVDADPDLRSRRPEVRPGCDASGGQANVGTILRKNVSRIRTPRSRWASASGRLPMRKARDRAIFSTEEVRLLVAALRSRRDDARVEWSMLHTG